MRLTQIGHPKRYDQFRNDIVFHLSALKLSTGIPRCLNRAWANFRYSSNNFVALQATQKKWKQGCYALHLPEFKAILLWISDYYCCYYYWIVDVHTHTLVGTLETRIIFSIENSNDTSQNCFNSTHIENCIKFVPYSTFSSFRFKFSTFQLSFFHLLCGFLQL